METAEKYVRCPQCQAINCAEMGDDCWDCHYDLGDIYAYQREHDPDVAYFDFVECTICYDLMVFGADECLNCSTTFGPSHWIGGPETFPGHVQLPASLDESYLPYDAIMLCCHRPIEACECQDRLDYRKLNDAPDFYLDVQRCRECFAFDSSACGPLRIAAKAFYHEDTMPSGISKCSSFLTFPERDHAVLLSQAHPPAPTSLTSGELE